MPEWRKGPEHLVLPERGVSKLDIWQVLRFVRVYQGEPSKFRENLADHFGVSVRTVERYLPKVEYAYLVKSEAEGSSHVRRYRLTPMGEEYVDSFGTILPPGGRVRMGVHEYFAKKCREYRKARSA